MHRTEQEVISQLCKILQVNCCEVKSLLSDCRNYKNYNRRFGWDVELLNQYFTELEKFGSDHIEIV